MSALLLTRLAQKSLRRTPHTQNLVRSPKSFLATRPSTAVPPTPLIRYTSSVTPPTTWVDRFPASIRPYIYLTRIDKPIGTLLLFYPCGTFLFFRAAVGTSCRSYPTHIPQGGLSPWPPTRTGRHSRPRSHISVYSVSAPSSCEAQAAQSTICGTSISTRPSVSPPHDRVSS